MQCVYGLNVRWGSTRESFINAAMPQTGLGVGTKDALHDLLQTINTSPKLHRLIDTTFDGEGRGILIKCLYLPPHLHPELTRNHSSFDDWISTPC